MIFHGIIIRVRLTLHAILFIAILSFGCAPRTKEMVVHNLPQANAVHDPVIITVSGGYPATLMGSTLVSNENFSTALAQSLRKTGLFRSVETSGNAPYILNVTLENPSRASEHASTTFGLKVDWRLMRPPNKILWHTKTEAFFSGSPGGTFVALQRLRMATEEAARRNIEQALAELASLNF
jgi:hypothetical protein